MDKVTTLVKQKLSLPASEPFHEIVHRGTYGKIFRFAQSRLVAKIVSTNTVDCEREWEIMSTLKHPTVVRLFKYFPIQLDNETYCAMIIPFYPNTLKSLIMDISPMQRISYAIQLCDAVQYCHSKKILHRDIKPENIFIKDDALVLGDFGLSKKNNGQRVNTIRASPIIYSAPEMIMDLNTGKHITEEAGVYDERIDLWSLGCVLYEMRLKKHKFKFGDDVWAKPDEKKLYAKEHGQDACREENTRRLYYAHYEECILNFEDEQINETKDGVLIKTSKLLLRKLPRDRISADKAKDMLKTTYHALCDEKKFICRTPLCKCEYREGKKRILYTPTLMLDGKEGCCQQQKIMKSEIS